MAESLFFEFERQDDEVEGARQLDVGHLGLVALLRASRASRAHVVRRKAEPRTVGGREARAIAAGAERDVPEAYHVLRVSPPAGCPETAYSSSGAAS